MATARMQEVVLQSLHDSPVHIVQMEAWEDDLKAFERLKTDDEDELRRFRWEAYQVATMYVTFQVVIIAAVSQSARLTCVLWWCPASFCAAVYAATLVAIAHKLKSIGDLEEEIKVTGLMISAIVGCLDEMQQRGSALDLGKVYPQSNYRRSSDAGFRFLLSPGGLYALLFLTSSSVMVGSFCIHVLCKKCASCHA